MFIGFTSLGGAFVPGCPFRFAFSVVILFFRFFSDIIKVDAVRIPARIPKEMGSIWNLHISATGYATWYSGVWFTLFFIPAAIPIAYSARQEVVHKPQKYKIPHLAFWAFLLVSLPITMGLIYGDPIQFPILYFFFFFFVSL